LPAFVDRVLDVSICGGVEIQGLHASVAPKRGLQTAPTLEEYKFVPNVETPSIPVSPSLEEYAEDCVNYTLDNLNKLLKEDTTNSLSNKQLLQDVVKNNRPTKSTDLQNRISEPNSGLAQALVQLFSLSVSSNLKENVHNLILKLQSELAHDKLLSNLDTPEILKPCVDIVIENVQTHKLSVFEAGASQSSIYRKIIPLIKTQPLLNLNYTAADKSPLDNDAKNFGVKSSTWDMKTSTSLPPGQVHFLVLKNVLHKQADIENSFRTVSEMVTPEGFILVEEVTKNFPLYLALEALAEKVTGDSQSTDSANVCRVCGCYLNEGSWVEVFSRSGFEVVYRKSDNLLSTLFLLRKKAQLATHPILFPIDDLECSWLEDLKSKMKDLEKAPEDARLWLISEQPTNGIVGFFNCLRLEAGGEKVRSIFISNLKSSSSQPQISVTSTEFKKLADKDLVANVYRDGEWGSFRHILLPEGKL
jgi:fatty acid synthase, animal type